MKSAAQLLRENFVLTKVVFHWWGERRQVEKSTKQQMVNAIDAEGSSISASKKLYSRDIDCIKEINSLQGEIKEWWESITLPYSTPGQRMLKKEEVQKFDAQMKEYQDKLRDCAVRVNFYREEIIEDARKRLGSSFNLGNYPLDLAANYSLEWSFPNLEPSGELPPQIYEQQKAYVSAKLEEAVNMAEQAFLHELNELVLALHERLTPDPSGQKKIFRDSAIDNFKEFFDRFQKLSLSSNDELEKIVTEARELISGVSPEELRKGKLLRQEICDGLGSIQNKLTPLVVNKPRRAIVINPNKSPQPLEEKQSA